ncbi:MAG: hypothetical protein RLZZ324_357 [Candidatus Parcubacteria bacterium]
MAQNIDKHFSEAELALIARVASSVTDNVYVLKDMHGLAGAVLARVSRAATGVRETIVKEFMRDGELDHEHAAKLIERVLIAFGDDSVGELEGAHLVLERISMLLTKEWEDRRIGGSPIEKSTRYVFFDALDANGKHQYYRCPDIAVSGHGPEYEAVMDFVFQTYSDLVEPMKEFFKARKPIADARYAIREDSTDKIALADCTDEKEAKAFRMTYNQDMRTMACDALRCILPLATLTNVAIFGNGRFFQGALSHSYGSPLAEARDVAYQAQRALETVIPHYVKRAAASHYGKTVRDHMTALAKELLGDRAARTQPGITLWKRDTATMIDALVRSGGLNPDTLEAAMQHEDDTLVIASMLYPFATLTLTQITDAVRQWPEEKRARVRDTYIGDRKTRRDRPGRAFESGYPYTFDLETDFGTYKDLERHRMGTQQRQLFTPTLGFEMPAALREAGFATRIEECVARVSALHAKLAPTHPHAAQYLALHGSVVRWTLGMNDRALQHMIELRTTPQGHPSYRRACQEMHRCIAARSPWRGAAMKFVDHNDYDSARGDAEASQRRKEAKLEITVRAQADAEEKEPA